MDELASLNTQYDEAIRQAAMSEQDAEMWKYEFERAQSEANNSLNELSIKAAALSLCKPNTTKQPFRDPCLSRMLICGDMSLNESKPN